MNDQNLKPLDTLPPDEARVIRVKGGKASGEKRKQARTLKEAFNILKAIPTKKGKVLDDKDFTDIETLLKSNLKAIDKIALQQFKKALDGDTKASIFISEILGEKQEQIKIDTSMSDEARERVEALIDKELKGACKNANK